MHERYGPPIRTLELVRSKFIQVLEVNALKQTFYADVFFEFKIRGGAHDEDLMREGDGPPTQNFPPDTLRPSARWYLGQIEFSNCVVSHLHKDTTVVTRGDDIHLRYRSIGEFSEQLELEDFPFDTQELTVKLIVHCMIGGFVGIEFVPPEYSDEHVGAHGLRSVPRSGYDAMAVVSAPALRIPRDRFKVDSFHLGNVWDMSADVTGTIGVHAGEFPELRMTALVRRKPQFYLWNVVVTMVLLQAMSFAAYALDATDIEGLSGRISLTVTLVLACGIYRSANAQFSPPVATLTLLDEYVLLAATIIGFQVVTHALASVDECKWLEPWFIGAHVVFVVAQHGYSFIYRKHGAMEVAQELGFVSKAEPGESDGRASDWRRCWGTGQRRRFSVSAATHVLNVVRVFSVEQGKYVEVRATAVERDEQEKSTCQFVS